MVTLGLTLLVVGGLLLMRKAKDHLMSIKKEEGDLVELKSNAFIFIPLDQPFLEANIKRITLMFSPFHYPKSRPDVLGHIKRMKAIGLSGLSVYILGIICFILKILFPTLSRF